MDRVGIIDEAFKSRVHVSLYYPHLDYSSSQKVLAMNLDLIERRFRVQNKAISIDKQEILDYVMFHWDKHPGARWSGRQIRNGCQAALALAEYDAGFPGHNGELRLEMKHMRAVYEAHMEFYGYLEHVRVKLAPPPERDDSVSEDGSTY